MVANRANRLTQWHSLSCLVAGIGLLSGSLLVPCFAQEVTTDEAERLTVHERQITLAGAQFNYEHGYLRVPESRRRASQATIRIAFYQLRSTSSSPAAPVFVLPGGPGMSWIETINRVADSPQAFTQGQIEFVRDHFFVDLPAIGDVVIIDQRGAGLSEPRLRCAGQRVETNTDTRVLDDYRSITVNRAKQCLVDIHKRGIDWQSYNILEMTDDVNDLRRALGYRKINVFAGSFGSQWTFALLKQHPALVNRFILWGLEGLDHAYDSPTGVLDAISSIYDDTVRHNDSVGQRAAFRDVLRETLESVPADRSTATKTQASSLTVDDIQGALLGMGQYSARNRLYLREWFVYINELLSGIYHRAMPVLHDRVPTANHGDDPLAQYYSIDCGLGISDARRTDIERDPNRPVIGNINWEYDLICPVWPSVDVGDEFRAPVHDQTPGLFVQGTWDTSTPIRNAEALLPYFPNVRQITVERATHRVIDELYMELPDEFRHIVVRFLRGETIEVPRTMTLPPIELDDRDSGTQGLPGDRDMAREHRTLRYSRLSVGAW